MDNEIMSDESSYLNLLKYYISNKYSIGIVLVILICAGFYLYRTKYNSNTSSLFNTPSKADSNNALDYCILDKNKKLVKVSENFFNQLMASNNNGEELFKNTYKDQDQDQDQDPDEFKASDIIDK